MSDDGLKEVAPDYLAEPAKPPFESLAEAIETDRIKQARQMSPEQKFLAGEELFEYACSITLAGIRVENPGLSEEDCLQILEERLAWRERQDWEEAGS